MDYRIILSIMIIVCVALGMFVGRFVLSRPSGGELIIDTSDPEKDKWLIKLYEPTERMARRHQVVLDVTHRPFNEGDPEWPKEK